MRCGKLANADSFIHLLPQGTRQNFSKRAAI
jgi:hypothetical protein